MTDSSIPARALSNTQMRTPSANATDNVGERTKPTGQPHVRRRNRIISSCLECRRRKLKCDRGQPCSNCVKVSRQCHFIAAGHDAAAQARLAEVKEKMGILERGLETDVAQQNRAQKSLSFPVDTTHETLERNETHSGDEEDIENLRSSEYAREDAVYYEDEDCDDDITDLGIALGKVRITERIGGMVRPKFSDELSQALKELPNNVLEGPTPLSVDAVDWMMPSTDYVAPSAFLFAPGVERRTLTQYLPTRTLVDKLMTHYWQAVHVVAKAVHRQSFERQYERFWGDIAAGVEPRNSFQAVVFAALLNSVVSMSSEKVTEEFGVEKQGLLDNFREATEAALSRANLLGTTKLETLQAFVMYLIPLCRAEVSRAHSALTGTCIRLAECMGLHKDPTAYSTSPIECQVRRLIWHQVCFLDLRTCEATGPRPQIRPDDFDTRMPLNIDDIDLDRAEQGDTRVDVENDRNYCTDMTITRMRFECYAIHRFLWIERPKLGKKSGEGEKKVTINSLLARIQSFRADMEKTYLPMLSKALPLHALASEIYGILSNRLYIHILQNYLSSNRHKMPQRLRQIALSAAILILEHSQNIEQQAALSTWSWYVGALHQYHTALLILNEMYAQPRTPAMEQRAWRALDFVFGSSPNLSPMEKTRAVLEELALKTQAFANIKRWRAPKDMPPARPRTQTPGYQLQQQVAREKEDNITTEAASANEPTAFARVNHTDLHTPLSLQQSFADPQQSQSSFSSAISFPGAMPHADWGTFDIPLPASTFTFLQPLAKQEVQPISNHPQNMQPGSPVPSPPALLQNNGPVGFVAPFGTPGSSPMDALNEIDWNEIEQLFGGAETDTGNIMIPPFTFPQFSATDLQWPQSGFH